MIDLSSHKKRNVLVVDSNIRDINTANGRAVNELIIALNDINFNVIAAATFEDGAATVISDSSLCCILSIGLRVVMMMNPIVRHLHCYKTFVAVINQCLCY